MDDCASVHAPRALVANPIASTPLVAVSSAVNATLPGPALVKP
jgi:hypothetical protein